MTARRLPTSTAARRDRVSRLREASRLYARLLRGCGFESDEIHTALLRALPKSKTKSPLRRDLDLRYYAESPHVITHWYQDPALLQPTGQPRALPLFGNPSVASLVTRVSARLDPQIMVAYLVHIGGIHQTPTGWLPTRRALLYANDRVSQSWRGFESLLGLLRAVDHNVHKKPGEPAWYENRVTSGEIPDTARRRIDRRTRDLGDDFLFALDRELQLQETRSRKKPTRSIRIGVGTYFYELPTSHAARPKKTRR